MPNSSPLTPPLPSAQARNLRLKGHLDTLVRSGRRWLRGQHRRRALRAAASWSPAWLPVLPGVLLVGTAFSGGAVAAPGALVLVCAALLGAVLFICVRVGWEQLRFKPARATALALHDSHLQTAERLVTADDFLKRTDLETTAPHGAFLRAAIRDADTVAHTALSTPLPRSVRPPWRVEPLSCWGAPVALALIVCSHLFFAPGGAPDLAPFAAPTLASDSNSATDQGEVARVAVARPVPPPPPPPEAAPPQDPTANVSRPVNRPPSREQPLDGQPGSGGGAQASGSNSGTVAAGLASSQRGEPQPQPPPDPQAEEPAEEPKTESKKTPRRPPDAGQMAVSANSGRGKSAGSSSSLNNFEAPEDPDKTGEGNFADAEDESAEDEDEQENSNSASKPMSNRRDPPVDRNLSPRAPQEGDQPGNGRGGPGDLKKTRGVPSMILGIPVPDRVPGMPGPGRSKVAQEHTRPTEEVHAALDAQSRLARSGPIGAVEQPDLLPWRRVLIENYFLAVRETPMADEAAAPVSTDRTSTLPQPPTRIQP